MRTQNWSRVDSDHSRYKAWERSSVLPTRDLHREFQFVHSWPAFQHRFSVTENRSRDNFDHSRYKARERSSVFPARDLHREFKLISSWNQGRSSICGRKTADWIYYHVKSNLNPRWSSVDTRHRHCRFIRILWVCCTYPWHTYPTGMHMRISVLTSYFQGLSGNAKGQDTRNMVTGWRVAGDSRWARNNVLYMYRVSRWRVLDDATSLANIHIQFIHFSAYLIHCLLVLLNLLIPALISSCCNLVKDFKKRNTITKARRASLALVKRRVVNNWGYTCSLTASVYIAESEK